ncbi:hypothetical protein V1687_12810 [Pseudomonas putida]|uniref:hypothetical protein n=1 Tax=Pseudomonas putida TaxID=303 RepID=UPI002ED61CFD|nr:hypothetical protein V1687_12810 [Pseudomonas putida]
MKSHSVGKVASRVLELLIQEEPRIVRVVGQAGSGFTPIIREILACPSVVHSSISIENIFFDSQHGLLGWVSNALGLYEGTVATHGKIPPHLLEIIQLRGIKYLVFDNFHDAFYLPGASKVRMAKDINALLCGCVGLRIIVYQIPEQGDSDFLGLLDYPVCDIRT